MRRARRDRVVWGCVAGGALVEVLLLAASLAALGQAPVPLPMWIAFVVAGAVLGGLLTVVATRNVQA